MRHSSPYMNYTRYLPNESVVQVHGLEPAHWSWHLRFHFLGTPALQRRRDGVHNIGPVHILEGNGESILIDIRCIPML